MRFFFGLIETVLSVLVRYLSCDLINLTSQTRLSGIHSSFNFNNEPFRLFCFLLQVTFTGTFTIKIADTHKRTQGGEDPPQYNRLSVDQPRNVKYLPPWLNGSRTFNSDYTTLCIAIPYDAIMIPMHEHYSEGQTARSLGV